MAVSNPLEAVESLVGDEAVEALRTTESVGVPEIFGDGEVVRELVTQEEENAIGFAESLIGDTAENLSLAGLNEQISALNRELAEIDAQIRGITAETYRDLSQLGNESNVNLPPWLSAELPEETAQNFRDYLDATANYTRDEVTDYSSALSDEVFLDMDRQGNISQEFYSMSQEMVAEYKELLRDPEKFAQHYAEYVQQCEQLGSTPLSQDAYRSGINNALEQLTDPDPKHQEASQLMMRLAVKIGSRIAAKIAKEIAKDEDLDAGTQMFFDMLGDGFGSAGKAFEMFVTGEQKPNLERDIANYFRAKFGASAK